MNKRNIIITALAGLFIFGGCEALDSLECIQEKPIKEATEGFMNSKEDIESVLFSSYHQIRRYHCFSRYYHTIAETMTDYSYGYGSYEASSYYEGLDPTLTSRTNDVWACFYRAVRFANSVVLNAPDAKEASPEQIAALVAEARFLRAFCYLHLVQCWGAVPYITDRNMHQQGDINYPRVPVAEILAGCAADLEYAAQNLPDVQSMAGRPQKMTANTVLTEVYLHQKEYAKAEAAALAVIESGNYSLIPVSVPDDFYNLYHPDLASSSEEIFYLKYADGMDKDLGSSFAAMLHRGGNYFNGSNYFGIYSIPENKRMADWPDADLRKEFNVYEIDSEGEIYLYNKKFIATNANGDSAGNDLPLYRYADLLLYYAEAACMANGGPTADAVEKLNMVHRRAYGKPADTPDASVDFELSDFTDADSFMKVVIEERLYETCYEGKRYNDLKRLGLLEEYVAEAKDGQTVGEGGYWFPIPNDEFLYNKGMNVNTDQNPGY